MGVLPKINVYCHDRYAADDITRRQHVWSMGSENDGYEQHKDAEADDIQHLNFKNGLSIIL